MQSSRNHRSRNVKRCIRLAFQLIETYRFPPTSMIVGQLCLVGRKFIGWTGWQIRYWWTRGEPLAQNAILKRFGALPILLLISCHYSKSDVQRKLLEGVENGWHPEDRWQIPTTYRLEIFLLASNEHALQLQLQFKTQTKGGTNPL